MWPFKKRKREPSFLISEEAYKQHIKEHLLIELLGEHLEYHNGQWILPGTWGDAIHKGLSNFDDIWQDTLKNYQTANLGIHHTIYIPK